MSDSKQWIDKTREGFKSLDNSDEHKANALRWIKDWLTKDDFKEYTPQIKYLIESEKWDFLLDSFYQEISFGTGGRRGLVGIGPNRINTWTIQSSAQGHSQYLIREYGGEAKTKGVVLTYDVRKYTQKGIYSDELANPVMNLDCKDLAIAAARVYTANGIKVYMFKGVRSTPGLSFAIRYLGTVAGDMFSASHNLPTDNGKKVYDEFGGQLIPPFDQNLVDEVTKNVGEINTIDLKDAENKGLIEYVGDRVDKAYHEAVCSVSLSRERDIRILYSPLHGTGLTSVYPVLKKLGFHVILDLATSNLSGAFENVTFNIPNPEVRESFDAVIPAAERMNADIILSTDPDADRIGVMVRHKNSWEFLNGNEIGILLTEYAIGKFKDKNLLNPDCMIIKTDVTTSLIDKIALANQIQCKGDLLVGFKYIGEEMNQLEKAGKHEGFILGTEESHGYIMGNYCRDKDAAGAAVWISELAAELKKENKTLIDFMDEIYSKYGYCHNYLTEIRLLGAKGIGQIGQIMKHLRDTDLESMGEFKVKERIDRWQGEPQPHLSKTDTSSRNVLKYYFKDLADTQGIKVTVRPSGTEPKFKIYFEIIGHPFEIENMAREKEKIFNIREKLERTFMRYCYQILNVDFPERGFLLFWQLPLTDKLKYFKIEDRIVELKNVSDPHQRKKELDRLFSFLGSNPIEKVDKAFKDKFGQGINEYLDII